MAESYYLLFHFSIPIGTLIKRFCYYFLILLHIHSQYLPSCLSWSCNVCSTRKDDFNEFSRFSYLYIFHMNISTFYSLDLITSWVNTELGANIDYYQWRREQWTWLLLDIYVFSWIFKIIHIQCAIWFLYTLNISPEVKYTYWIWKIKNHYFSYNNPWRALLPVTVEHETLGT